MDFKYGLMTDLHFGISNNNSDILNWQKKAMNKSIKYFKNNNVNNIIILGDVFDNQNLNSTLIMYEVIKIFGKLSSEFDNVWVLVGNHDMYYKNSREVNILSVLLKNKYMNVHVVDQFTQIDNISLCPWIVDEKDIENIKNDNKNILIAHLEINGFYYNKQSKISTKGLNKSLFKKYDMVLSGHFHSKQHQDNIHYLGTMMPLKWNEYNEPHGIHILNTETLELTFHDLEISMFDVLKFDKDKNYDLESLDAYKNKHVKILLQNWDRDVYNKMISNIGIVSNKYSTVKLFEDEKTIQDVSEMESDENVVGEYLNKNVPERLDPDVAMKIYEKFEGEIVL